MSKVTKPKAVSVSVVGPVCNCRFQQFVLGRHRNKPYFINQGVYVLELNNGKEYYIGKSMNILERIKQHQTGEKGSEFTKGKSIKRLMPLTPYLEDFESWERAETLKWMYLKGVSGVRGWMYTTGKLNKEQRNHAFEQICEKNDLCRKCGLTGHFVKECPNPKRRKFSETQVK